MPFKSERQRRFAYSDRGQRLLSPETVRRWTEETADTKLPDRVTPKDAPGSTRTGRTSTESGSGPVKP